jgi:hypothetical protein
VPQAGMRSPFVIRRSCRAEAQPLREPTKRFLPQGGLTTARTSGIKEPCPDNPCGLPGRHKVGFGSVPVVDTELFSRALGRGTGSLLRGSCISRAFIGDKRA